MYHLHCIICAKGRKLGSPGKNLVGGLIIQKPILNVSFVNGKRLPTFHTFCLLQSAFIYPV